MMRNINERSRVEGLVFGFGQLLEGISMYLLQPRHPGYLSEKSFIVAAQHRVARFSVTIK